MPSAATKLDKAVSPEASDPIKQIIGIVDKKVRNLEKRKVNQVKADSIKHAI